ncbi:hypothetical protein ILYODFUR_021297 [Ilyodon furcidens]|uniref:Uncharacterized protein n=1 Tax=Ilyodon furcidens TaxID=33524 RepID=A0ABV0SR43_9TELE
MQQPHLLATWWNNSGAKPVVSLPPVPPCQDRDLEEVLLFWDNSCLLLLHPAHKYSKYSGPKLVRLFFLQIFFFILFLPFGYHKIDMGLCFNYLLGCYFVMISSHLLHLTLSTDSVVRGDFGFSSETLWVRVLVFN